jgi:hypothetical protein
MVRAERSPREPERREEGDEMAEMVWIFGKDT